MEVVTSQYVVVHHADEMIVAQALGNSGIECSHSFTSGSSCGVWMLNGTGTMLQPMWPDECH